MIAAYGLLIFALQFGFLFTGMKVGMSAGLASLILQLQVFFTIGLSVVVLGERPTAVAARRRRARLSPGSAMSPFTSAAR